MDNLLRGGFGPCTPVSMRSGIFGPRSRGPRSPTRPRPARIAGPGWRWSPPRQAARPEFESPADRSCAAVVRRPQRREPPTTMPVRVMCSTRRSLRPGFSRQPHPARARTAKVRKSPFRSATATPDRWRCRIATRGFDHGLTRHARLWRMEWGVAGRSLECRRRAG